MTLLAEVFGKCVLGDVPTLSAVAASRSSEKPSPPAAFAEVEHISVLAVGILARAVMLKKCCNAKGVEVCKICKVIAQRG
jgi:hypothetical protein